jgi:hypothetical protein
MDRTVEREEERAAIEALREKVAADGPTVAKPPWWGSLVILGLGIAFILFITWVNDYQLTFTSRDGSVYQFPWW